MIRTRAKTKSNFERVRKKQKAGTVTSLGHAGALTRKIVRNSIRKSKTAAPKGSPPRTRQGQLKKAILYDVDKQAGKVVIGPAAHLISRIGASHEHGLAEKATKKKPAKPPNFKLEIGGHGPVEVDGGSAYVKIRTARQLARVKRHVKKYGRTNDPAYRNVRRPQKPSGKVRKYPKRPFMGPGLAAAAPRLPKQWAGSVKA